MLGIMWVELCVLEKLGCKLHQIQNETMFKLVELVKITTQFDRKGPFR